MNDWIKKLQELNAANKSFCLATIVKTIGSSPRKGGTRMIVESEKIFHGTIGGGNLEHLVIKQAIKMLGKNESTLQNFPLDEEAGQVCGGSVDVHFESFGVSPKLYIFGAGHVGQAVCEILKNTLFDVHIIDERSEWLDKIQNGTVHKMHWKEFIKQNTWDKDLSFAVVMTPNHEFDLDIAALLVKKPLRYLGVIGSKNKWAHFKKQLLTKKIPEKDIKKIKSPIGLVKAGNEPCEIAISLSAELLDCYYNHA